MKAYHLSFRFDQPQPGVITIPATSADEAKQKLQDMLNEFRNVEIFEAIDLEEVPFLKKMYDSKVAAEKEDDSFSDILEELDNPEDNKDLLN